MVKAAVSTAAHTTGGFRLDSVADTVCVYVLYFTLLKLSSHTETTTFKTQITRSSLALEKQNVGNRFVWCRTEQGVQMLMAGTSGFHTKS